MNVLVYSGPEVLKTSLEDTVRTLRQTLDPFYAVQEVSSKALASQPWSAQCGLLVFPACDNLPCVPAVLGFVEGGGAVLALGARATDFESFLRRRTHLPLQQPFTRPTPRHSETDTPSGRVVIETTDGQTVHLTQHSVADTLSSTDHAESVTVLARYVGSGTHGEPAALKWVLGKGRAVFVGPNVETPLAEVSVPTVSSEAADVLEERRRNFFQNILKESALRLPSANDVPSQLQPLPQYLVSHTAQPTVVSEILSALFAAGSQLGVFEDSNDNFHFHNIEHDVPTKILEKRLSTDTSTRDLKHVIFCLDGQLPPAQQTPFFNLSLYFETLTLARASEGCTSHHGSWGMGEAVLYGEVVTSTQTMLDRNPRLLSTLPSPVLSIASYQLAGRGRGPNVWLSPPGSLLMSLFLRQPLSLLPAHKLVFVQYLFALSVVEACREDMVLGRWGEGVRVKWPNDLYVVTDGEPRKIGGVLVNTSFLDGNVHLVIGCGLNVLCSHPIMSLSQLLPPDTAPSTLPAVERTAAMIIAKFERMWSTFVAHNGSFHPFMDLYIDRWLHSDQLVTLTTVTPHMRVRIVGLTPDHGLLRTVPEKMGQGGKESDYVDLQPDGNSFDMLAGMIRTKTMS